MSSKSKQVSEIVQFHFHILFIYTNDISFLLIFSYCLNEIIVKLLGKRWDVAYGGVYLNRCSLCYSLYEGLICITWFPCFSHPSDTLCIYLVTCYSLSLTHFRRMLILKVEVLKIKKSSHGFSLTCAIKFCCYAQILSMLADSSIHPAFKNVSLTFKPSG